MPKFNLEKYSYNGGGVTLDFSFVSGPAAIQEKKSFLELLREAGRDLSAEIEEAEAAEAARGTVTRREE